MIRAFLVWLQTRLGKGPGPDDASWSEALLGSLNFWSLLEGTHLLLLMLFVGCILAVDLRLIVASLKTATDMERIGDYAANVAKRSVVLAQFNLPFSLSGIGSMARQVQASLKQTIDAISESDAEKAVVVWRSDQAIDDLYNTIFRELITYMMEDPRNITPCTHLLFIAKNLERIGDHCTNIAETVHFAVRGENIQDARPKSDNSPYAVVRQRES